MKKSATEYVNDIFALKNSNMQIKAWDIESLCFCLFHFISRGQKKRSSFGIEAASLVFTVLFISVAVIISVKEQK